MRSFTAASLAGVLLAACTAAPAQEVVSDSSAPPSAAELRVDLEDRLSELRFDEKGNVLLETPDGPRAVDAGTFAAAVRERQNAASRRHWLLQAFNVEGPVGLAWVVLGLVGQLAFMGRMVVQWLTSEKHKRSVVPTAFWWMSLVGGTMVLAYFIWRRDPVGIFGQAMGWVIYVRNLWLIYRPGRPAGQDTAALPTINDVPTGPSLDS